MQNQSISHRSFLGNSCFSINISIGSVSGRVNSDTGICGWIALYQASFQDTCLTSKEEGKWKSFMECQMTTCLKRYCRKERTFLGIIDIPLYDGDNELYSEYRIMNVCNHRIYTDKFAIKVLNLRNIDISEGIDARILHWARIFKASTLKELEELAGEEEVFKNMILELRKLSKDEKIKLQMEARADYESRIATAKGAGYREGMSHGIEQGITQGKLITLKSLVSQNIISIDTAAKQAGMMVDEFQDALAKTE